MTAVYRWARGYEWIVHFLGRLVISERCISIYPVLSTNLCNYHTNNFYTFPFLNSGINPFMIPPLTSNSSLCSLVPCVASVEISPIMQPSISNSSSTVSTEVAGDSSVELNNARKRADIAKTGRILGLYGDKASSEMVLGQQPVETIFSQFRMAVTVIGSPESDEEELTAGEPIDLLIVKYSARLFFS